jgi:hypothetical protein
VKSEAPKNNDFLTNIHIHTASTTETIEASEQIFNPHTIAQEVHNEDDGIDTIRRSKQRRRLIAGLFVLCLVAGIAAASRPISEYWPESREVFERLHLPVTTPQP